MTKKTREAAAGDPTSLGNVALMHGYIDDAQLKAALEFQQGTDSKIGESMVSTGAIGERTLQVLVDKQLQVRTKPSSRDVARIVDFASERLNSSATRIESTMRGLHGAIGRLLRR